jgi:hypothetical protein
MRISLLILASLALVSSATVMAETPSAATAVPSSEAAGSTQTATWTQRKLLQFSPPSFYVPANGYETNTHFLSCDEVVNRLTFVLQQLGARAGDLAVDQRDCRRGGPMAKSVDVTFSVLAPPDASKPAAGVPVEARWQIVQLGGADVDLGDCAFLRYVTLKILPLFSTRNVKLIAPADCARVGVGLRAEVLRPAQQLADTRLDQRR